MPMNNFFIRPPRNEGIHPPRDSTGRGALLDRTSRKEGRRQPPSLFDKHRSGLRPVAHQLTWVAGWWHTILKHPSATLPRNGFKLNFSFTPASNTRSLS